ncbi:MAG TPA: PDZ domain-containing protein [Gemmataceae bacterium]|jgi:hypothetical protein|nr:PDZ domain-containing protein [Gemmataceae bacterium]
MRYLFCAFTAALLVVPLRAEEPQPVAVPFKLTDTKHIMVRLKLNGKGPFNFIVDTGAPALFVATAVAKKAGVEPDKDGWGKFDKVELEGGVLLEKFSARIEDPFQLKGMNGMGLAGVELHGMMGYTVLAKFKIQFDLTSDKLLFTPLKFDPPAPESLRDEKGGSLGGLELIGDILKFASKLLGFQGPPERKPRGFLGLDLERTDGRLLVKSVLDGSPAAKAGLKAGDKVTRFGSDQVDTVGEVTRRAAKKLPGDEITITIERDGKEQKLALKLGRGL